jgi:anthranilate synthase/aminodeoxychorismate synthase-like glutamine amidotransferase
MIVIIDNYDSFTYNLVQYYKQIERDVRVYRNDEVTIKEIADLAPNLIVISPGPGTPSESGVCRDIIAHFHKHIPILGVCLGFQLIVEYFGGKVIKGKQPMHGKVSKVTHDQLGVFKGITTPTSVTRYHSLVADPEVIPTELCVTSKAIDGAIMGVRHHTYPVEGIQFHPESILTENGFQMIKNSDEQAKKWMLERGVHRDESLSTF